MIDEPVRPATGPAPAPRERALAWAILLTSLAAYLWAASIGLHGARFYDERFSMQNVEAALASGSLRPANGWYPRLSWLPQTAVAATAGALGRLTGFESLTVLGDDGRATATTYLLCRLVSVACGVAALWLVWRLGRRLFGPAVGLGGLFLTAVTPWQIRASLEFKPDALLLMMTLLALHWTLDMARAPSAGGYARAGLGVGLALSSKLNGGVVALPLVLLTALRRRVRHWLWLVLAGATAVAVFVALNTPVAYYWSYFRRIHRFYSRYEESGFLEILGGEVQLLLSSQFHGWLVGGLALAGLLALVWEVARRRPDPEAALARLLFVSFPIAYALLLAAGSGRAKNNNLVQLVPFTSIAAAWLVWSGWRWLAARRPALARPAVRLPLVVSAAALVALPGLSFTWRSGTVSTLETAGDRLRRGLSGVSRPLVAHEPLPRPLDLTGLPHHTATMEVESLVDVPRRTLERADAEVFPVARLRGRQLQLYLDRLVRGEPAVSEVAVIDPPWHRSRGPSLVVLVHPWQELGQPLAFRLPLRGQAPPEGRVYRGPLPRAVEPGDLVSIEIEPPAGTALAELRLSGRPMRLFPTRRGGALVSERMSVGRRRAPLRVELAGPAATGAPLRLTARRWLDRSAP